MSVLLRLDASLPKPLYAQIRDQIKEHIASGTLKSGDRLEPSRELAVRLGVHRTTVSNAYSELQAEGLIEATVGRGTFISPLAATLSPPRRPATTSPGDRFWDSYFAPEQRDDSLGHLMASALDPGVVSFVSTRAPDELNPVTLVRRATAAVLRREGKTLIQYGSSDGFPPLKRFLQSWLRRQNIAAEPDEILITNGCQQSLALFRHALVSPGDTVVCENPTYPGLRSVFESPDIRLIGIPVGDDGMDLDFLAAVLEQNRVKLVLVSPSFQNPTGRVMSMPSRRRLLELAMRFQVPIVEDDIYSALRFAGPDVFALKALDTAGLVIYLNSFSKIGFPGFRVGWVVAARRVIDRLRVAKQRADLHTNLLAQAVLEELGRRGWLDKLIQRTRKVYQRKLAVLKRAAERLFPPEVRIVYPEGGMSAWVELPPSLDAVELLAKARERRVLFVPARYFYFQSPRHNAFRLCFTALPDPEIEKGIEVLGQLLKEELSKRRIEGEGITQGTGLALV